MVSAQVLLPQLSTDPAFPEILALYGLYMASTLFLLQRALASKPLRKVPLSQPGKTPKPRGSAFPSLLSQAMLSPACPMQSSCDCSVPLAPAEPWPWGGELFQEGAAQHFPGLCGVLAGSVGAGRDEAMSCALYFWLQRHRVPCEAPFVSCSPSGRVPGAPQGCQSRRRARKGRDPRALRSC